MFNTVTYVNIAITFHFSNNTTLTVALDDESDNQQIDDIEIKTSLSSSTANPLGAVSASTLDLTLSSYDRSLFPYNEESSYYGYMDRTCYITITADKLYIDPDDEVNVDTPVEQVLQTPINLGTFFVDSWRSVESSDDANTVQISASDIISTIGNIEVPIVTLDTTQDATTYLRNVLAAINTRLPAYKRVTIASGATFGEFDDNVRYRNLKSDGTLIDLLNQLSRCLLCNIYINVNNQLEIDPMWDDSSEQPVYTMSDATHNLHEVQIQDGLLVDYSGACIKFPVDRSGAAVQIGQISDQSFDDLVFTNYHFDSGVYKLAYMVISSTTNVCPTVSSILHDNTELDLTLSYTGTAPDEDETYTVSMFGCKQNEGYTSTSEVTDDSVCEIENDLLQKANIQDYLDAVNEYMNNKRSGVTCSGWFDPRLKLGDVVVVDSSLLNIYNTYKVTAITWNLTDDFRCDVELRAITHFNEGVE